MKLLEYFIERDGVYLYSSCIIGIVIVVESLLVYFQLKHYRFISLPLLDSVLLYHLIGWLGLRVKETPVREPHVRLNPIQKEYTFYKVSFYVLSTSILSLILHS